MQAENEFGVPLLDESPASTPAAPTGEEGERTSEPAVSGVPTAESGEPDSKVVPLARFREVERQVRRYRELGLDALADELERDPTKIHEIRAALARGYIAVQPQPQPADLEKAREQWQRLYEQDPLAATLMTSQAAVTAALEKALGPVKQLALRQSIEGFKSRARSSVPFFASVETYFDRLVAQRHLDGMDPAQLDRVLGEILFTAMGIAYAQSLDRAQRRGVKLPQQTPPVMGGTGGAPGGTAERRAPQADAKTLEAIRDVARLGGLEDKELDELLSSE